MMFSREIFCQRLRQLRLSRNLTAKQLGAAFAVRKQTVSRWELGDRLPTLDIAVALAEYFNVSLDYLVGTSDNPKRK
ncbi:helix-turn-helix domain-containing protein [Megasphaera sueciensis]|uniref:helix-turn-helix domain-containing protein n=1 Tax=Megasphaera sueciensis TaxID=349094 RepID=UPI003CFF0E38